MFLIFSTEKQNNFFSASVLSHCPVTNDKSIGQKKKQKKFIIRCTSLKVPKEMNKFQRGD